MVLGLQMTLVLPEVEHIKLFILLIDCCYKSEYTEKDIVLFTHNGKNNTRLLRWNDIEDLS